MKDQLDKKWILGELSAEEEEKFRQTEDYAQLNKIWQGLATSTPPFYDVEAELDRFRKDYTKSKVGWLTWQKSLLGIAASVILAVLIGYLVIGTQTKLDTTLLSEVNSPLYLPDSSRVILNKGSKLEYDAESWATERRVSLTGEGFFKVKPASRFVVATSDGEVTVLGTSFNVRNRDQYFEVRCFEGKVAVKTADTRTALTAGDGFQRLGSNEMSFDFSPGEGPGWLEGESIFYKVPLSSVLAELENQFDVSVEANDISLEGSFTGNFPNNDLKTALDVVTMSAGYHYQMKGDKVVIFSESN
ncbi:MAG: FecR domain-containing protein [Imperialibacter sp.]|uniref:FecR family protein n=1 Tax=Imperialibacter sp. TaxID=2038411 RepID=UPI0032EB6533